MGRKIRLHIEFIDETETITDKEMRAVAKEAKEDFTVGSEGQLTHVSVWYSIEGLPMYGPVV